ncbi:UNVERIFIED_CONTAM: hypothetical protein PYX00_004879 [Menopon gallinae]
MIGYVNNMFVRYVIPVKEFLKFGRNILLIRFKSPILEASRLAEASKYNIPPECPPPEQFGECHINFLRKMQASFSWDWGPAFPSVGIWKSIEIEAYDYAVIRDVTVTTKLHDAKWFINTTSYVESHRKDFPYVIVATIFLMDDQSSEKTVAKLTKQTFGKSYNFTTDLTFEIKQEKLDVWWPNGFGNQPLYTLSVEIFPLNRTEGQKAESRKEIKFGVRTIELVQEPINPHAEGLTFYFKVNGIPIFMKGSNWIPAHILPEFGCEEETVKHLLLSAKDAHMNMLRVWGGGVYESDYFYQLADELGILIWQDLMFAVALYPTDDTFLTSVSVEVEQQILRLQHHPCIAVWAGNNENEAALGSNWFDTNSSFELYKRDYIKFYVDTIEPIVKRIDDSRSYIVSSPSNGLKSREEGHIARNPYSPLYGDVHYYNYNDDPWNASKVTNTRFASEYGFQSLPSYLALERVSKAEDRILGSRFMKRRQHHRRGYEEMFNLIRYNLPLDNDNNTENYLKTFIYFSQIYQAMAVKTETEKYRRDRGRVNKDNEKFTMGALYWQLNDVWEAPTWSSIEYQGRWKMLHHYALNFFKPVLVSPVINETGNVDVFIVSDLLEDVTDVNLNISVYSWASFQPRMSKSAVITVEKASSKIYAAVTLDEVFQTTNCTRNTCFLHFRLSHPEIHSSNNQFLSSFSNVPNLQPPHLRVLIQPQIHQHLIELQLSASAIAPFVWLETEVDGQFSANGFLQLRETKKIYFRSRGAPIDFERFRRTLKVRSLLS